MLSINKNIFYTIYFDHVLSTPLLPLNYSQDIVNFSFSPSINQSPCHSLSFPSIKKKKIHKIEKNKYQTNKNPVR